MPLRLLEPKTLRNPCRALAAPRFMRTLAVYTLYRRTITLFCVVFPADFPHLGFRLQFAAWSPYSQQLKPCLI